MEQHTLFVETGFLGEVAAYVGQPNSPKTFLLNATTLNTFSTGHSISQVNGRNHFFLIEGVVHPDYV
jgi:hypothetical protein